jgi:hypothetical protein
MSIADLERRSGISLWNTGRLYDEHGQFMAAIAIGDRIYFVDVSRGISGTIDVEARHHDGDLNLIRCLVDAFYLSADYKMPDDSATETIRMLKTSATAFRNQW